MNLFGVGVLELAVIFLIAFLVMGPVKSIEMARSAGKLIGELRRTVNEMTTAADLSGREPASAPRPGQPPSPTSIQSPSQSPGQSQDLTEGRTQGRTQDRTEGRTQGPSAPPATGAVPTTGAGDGNEQQS